MQHRFVFIGGLHRSGTTLLNECLGHHPEIAALTGTGVPMNEGQFLQQIYFPARRKRKLWPIRYFADSDTRKLSTSGYGGPGRFGFDPGAFLTEASPIATKESARAVFDSWKPYWDLNCTLLLEKSPPNLVRMRFLQQLFPNSYFITLYRHPIPVSYATQKWSGYRPLHLLFKHWLVCHKRYQEDQDHLRHVLDVRFEEFIRSPQRTLDKIFEFLGIDSVMLNKSIDSSTNDRYFERWRRASRVSIIRNAYHQILTRRFEREFNQYGYSLDVIQP